MALLFMDGFGGGDSGSKWGTGSTATYTPSTSSPRLSGGYYFSTAGSGNTLVKQLTPAVSTCLFGFGLRWASTFFSGFYMSFYSDSGATQQISIVHNETSGFLEVRRGSNGGTLLTTGTQQLLMTQWNYIEISVSISATVGEVHIRLNGATTDHISFTGNTKAGGTNNTVDKILLNGASYDFADVYIADTTGTANNTFLGDVAVRTLTPTGNGTYSQLVGSDSDSINNYQLVDEHPYSGTDYVGSANTGDKDSYTMSDLPAGITTVYGVQICGLMSKSDANLAQARYFVRSSGTDYPSTTQVLNTSFSGYYDLRSTDPATGVAWTVSGVNNVEVGMEVR